jgi:dTMP kinase
VTLFGAGLLAIVAGIVCFRLMDDRRDVALRTDMLAAVLRRDLEQGRGTRAGYFLALEGGEGAGKSTLARRLAEELRGRGYDVLLTFEPGDTAVGARIREVLLDPASRGMSARTEAMLYAADRAQHVSEVIRPALERNAIVVCDRYVDSSRAYQGGGRSLDDREISHLSRWATNGLQPDLTVLLDLDPEEGLRRASRTGATDRLEAETLEFHRRVRAEFLLLARRGRHRYLVVDATGEPDAVFDRVLGRLAEEALPDLPASRTTMTIPLAETPR